MISELYRAALTKAYVHVNQGQWVSISSALPSEVTLHWGTIQSNGQHEAWLGYTRFYVFSAKDPRILSTSYVRP